MASSLLSPRNTSQIVRSRGIGAWVGTLIGLGWMAYGLASLPNLYRVSLGGVGLGIALYLLHRARNLIAASRNLPAPDSAASAASRRVWTWFWLNFALEIILLNVAVNLLSAPSLRLYWIPAISGVVGLHFFPMARFFEVPSYWVCGGAMIAISILVAIAVHASAFSPPVLVAGEAIANALILWATAAWGIYATERQATIPA